MQKLTLTEITDRLTLVVLQISIWSGRKKLRAEDLSINGAFPPGDLVSLGSKRVCDPEQLKVFARLKQATERACLKYGTRFLGGYAVPTDKADELVASLSNYAKEFQSETNSFVADYEQSVERWVQTLPEFEAPIRAAIEPVDAVRNRFRFSYQLVRVSPASNAGMLDQEVASLGDGIFGEIEQMARELSGSFVGKDKLHRRALNTFHRVKEKLNCLSFVDNRLDPVVKTIDDWLCRLPDQDQGPIDGGLFLEGYALALLLSDSNLMAKHGAGQLSMAEAAAEAKALSRQQSVANKKTNHEDELVTVPLSRNNSVTKPAPASFFF
ncbi:DUF3150 domain-containing protein [Lamprobacter modestohalophilus]|uniref:DUF3150 domain-containing protein n=1 Tax=Lamprobacter modestohalophilus TaxID=1064514 RepID=UPI002ADEE713|nr:DUF3150 domain-containing protein [Lamprobacter modestohalophilus]MEA1048396.1 DUF3150 domain-containing protein [Lamprobacter modestohalophilus]